MAEVTISSSAFSTSVAGDPPDFERHLPRTRQFLQQAVADALEDQRIARRREQHAAANHPDVAGRAFGQVAVAEHQAFEGAGVERSLAREHVAQQRDRLDVAVQPALVGQGDRIDALFDRFARHGLELARHRKYRRCRVRRKDMIAPRHAPGHMQVHELVAPGVARQQFGHQPRPAAIVHRIGDPHLAQAALEPREMLRPPKRHALVNRHDFIDAVAEDEAAIQHRHLRLRQRHELAIEIDGLFLLGHATVRSCDVIRVGNRRHSKRRRPIPAAAADPAPPGRRRRPLRGGAEGASG